MPIDQLVPGRRAFIKEGVKPDLRDYWGPGPHTILETRRHSEPPPNDRVVIVVTPKGKAKFYPYQLVVE